LIECLKLRKQHSAFSGTENWIFASPIKLGRLPYSCTGARQEIDSASESAGIGHISTHSFRHNYRSWLDAVRTSNAAQQKMMKHTDIRTTMNICRDVVADEMSMATLKVASLPSKSTERNRSANQAKLLIRWWAL
jgi:integrase